MFRFFDSAHRVAERLIVRVTISRMKFRLTGILISLVLFSSFALAAENPDFTVKKLGEGIYAAVSGDGSKAGSNAGFIVGSNGVLVVDTFEDVAPAKELLAEIRKVTKLPIKFVVNTHYHLDHTGGNAVFAQEGATIIAQRNLRGWLNTENLKFFGPNPKPEARARVNSLSQRQLQVLRGILKGQANKVIAYELSLSIRTVEAYRAQLLEKLGVRGTAEAVRLAIAAGMLEG